MSNTAIRLSPDDVERLVAQNIEMRRLLETHQWSGLTPLKSHGVCPECCGCEINGGHRPGCAIAAAVSTG